MIMDTPKRDYSTSRLVFFSSFDLTNILRQTKVVFVRLFQKVVQVKGSEPLSHPQRRNNPAAFSLLAFFCATCEKKAAKSLRKAL